jgi:ATP-dependent RNA helicase RhlE
MRARKQKEFLLKFDQFQLDPRVAAGVQASRYDTATPIQEQAIPLVLEGRDLMGIAQTGTGKTAAFALPILNRLLSGPRGTLRALVLAPTRELAEQICGSFRTLGAQTRLKVATVYGGVSIRPHIEALRRGVDIVVACPGRLLDHINQRTINLKQLEVLVLDEGDMMLDMGFLPDVRRILKTLPARRQSLMFSATMPQAIGSLAAEFLHRPAMVEVCRQAPVETVSHALYPVAQHLKTALLLELLAKTDAGSVLVFTRTKRRAKRLGDQLAKEGHRATSLQGDLAQNARQAALTGFRTGRYDVLVATDIAARGIDVTQVSHVINYDIPDTTDAYTHRIGRTGRAQRNGDAFTLVTGEDTAMIRDIERVIGSRIERRQLEGFDYSQQSAAPVNRVTRAPRPVHGRSSAPAGGTARQPGSNNTRQPGNSRQPGNKFGKPAHRGAPAHRGSKKPFGRRPQPSGSARRHSSGD